MSNQASNTYLGNPRVRGADAAHPWTKEELVEYARCVKDPMYFAKSIVR
mgnify:FL=1